ncbi:hypothetical protein S1OALGB6SA_1356 [Olavius algarvensis spirochete endosymbiont]|nr:hypothetical protein S1OALGB6SA_1356 [Olavius algarvensis spirochete endosymbiont]
MHEGASLTHLMMVLVLQLTVILLAAKGFGFVCVRFLRQPSVLGELVAGMIVGPFALGGIALPFLGGEPLFAISSEMVLPVTPQLYGFATVGSVVLLFISGLETDLKTFLRFAGSGSLVGFGGVVCSYFLGALSALAFIPDVVSIFDPRAMFMGIIATATSVGITARILSERRRLSSPEGVTILSAVVFDDVLGIVLLALVIGLVRMGGGEGVDWRLLGRITLKAFGFWIGSTVIGIVLAPRITKGLKELKDLETLAVIAFGLALLLAGLSELAGLAMIIGAYVMGLALSSTDVAEDIRRRLEGLQAFIVPVFFCVMGMLVDFRALGEVFVYGLIYAGLGIFGKLVGCGLPALMLGFNGKGALRIGTGMLPRGEVTLIMAGLGLTTGVIGPSLFGVAVISMLISSLVAPPILLVAFRGGSGFRKTLGEVKSADLKVISFAMPTIHLADFVLSRLLDAFRRADYFPRRVGHRKPVYIAQKDAAQITLLRQDRLIQVNAPSAQEGFVRLLLTEEILALKELFRSVEKVADTDATERNILGDLFG